MIIYRAAALLSLIPESGMEDAVQGCLRLLICKRKHIIPGLDLRIAAGNEILLAAHADRD